MYWQYWWYDNVESYNARLDSPQLQLCEQTRLRNEDEPGGVRADNGARANLNSLTVKRNDTVIIFYWRSQPVIYTCLTKIFFG